MTDKGCKTCTFNEDGFCNLIHYHSYLHATYPKPACDEHFSGWDEKMAVTSVIVEVSSSWITSTANKIIGFTKPKTHDNELTKNELDN